MTLGAPGSPNRDARGTPAIDRSVLGEWLAGDEAAINELLTVFRDSVRAELERMRELLALDDMAEYANAAHRLRGAALSMGAHALADLVGVLYNAARAAERSVCLTGMAILATHVQLVSDEIPSPPADGTP